MTQEIGRIGVGCMGEAMVKRLVRHGARVKAWNLTRPKPAPMAEVGATPENMPVDDGLHP